MKTEETISAVCSELGITKADLAKRMGMLPSSLYRKLARESMTFEEFQKCLDVLGVTVEFELKFPNGNTRSSQMNHELLLERTDMLETELEAARKTAEFHKKSLRDLRTDLNSAVGYAELGVNHEPMAGEYLEKLRSILANMESAIAHALGETVNDEPDEEEPEIMKQILVDHGLLVEEADDGSRAVEDVKAQEPGYFHFILMDIEMPVMDGYEATTRIRKLPNRIRANVPVIALTANACFENRERAKKIGMDDFLVKPVNSSRLLKSLARFR